MKTQNNAENARLAQVRTNHAPWRKWGPYLSERQWGTVREDYSANGDAWNYFSHEQARSRAYRWGEDGIAGLSDLDMTLCLAMAFWNGRDPILKERLFGLTNGEGNHGEDVKEYYFYLDSTPTHSYMKMLYKYPQAEFPYNELLQGNRARSRADFEFELLDTGIFKDNRYFDIFVEYAKAGPDDILIKISAANRGPERAALHILPHLWFRNTGWTGTDEPVPSIIEKHHSGGVRVLAATHWDLNQRLLCCENAKDLLFTNNETNNKRLFGGTNASAYVKDGINNYIVNREVAAVNPQRQGTKAAAHYELNIGAGESQTVRLRFCQPAAMEKEPFGREFEEVFSQRLYEADEFYSELVPASATEDQARVIRQALAGMLWSKQTYIYEANRWLHEHAPAVPRNGQWSHLFTHDVISMPDKWEYPWFAAWDLAFHAVALAFVDPDFAQQQMDLMLREHYLHPNGQIPAYEWNFGDVNPPVHAWATVFAYRLARETTGDDRSFETLKAGFHKLLLNFTWWLNRKDRNGRNVFEGGFLGLDNIGVFDRSAALPGGGYLEQADGTAWMAFFSQNMLEIALELAVRDPVYEDLAMKFLEHFVGIASAMAAHGDSEHSMWDEEDGFYYDLLRFPDGNSMRLKVRSMVGLLPLCAVTVYPQEMLERLPNFAERIRWFQRRRPDMFANINAPGPGVNGRRILSIFSEKNLRRVLARMLDPNEFLGDYGIRSMSRYHLDHPCSVRIGSEKYSAVYSPAESDSGMFGGNSNWRGPIWMPVNVLLIRALIQMYSYYGDDFKVECPTGSGQFMTLFEVARELSNRLANIFLRNDKGLRPVYGGTEEFQTDPHWRDLILFYEYFHGDNGAGLGASHQTGWTGLVASLIKLFGTVTPHEIREHGLHAAVSIIVGKHRRSEETIRGQDNLSPTPALQTIPFPDLSGRKRGA
jgi:hypothetical protein